MLQATVPLSANKGLLKVFAYHANLFNKNLSKNSALSDNQILNTERSNKRLSHTPFGAI